MTRPRPPLVASALFVFYCTAVGVYLVLHPWLPGGHSGPGLSGSGFFRGFVSGIGFVHLFFAFADLLSLARSLDEAAHEPRPAGGDVP
jgi:formate hydrogenlyase subunit 3/multisubunit Na+/H+ antiporter MnhD subunit